MGSSLRVENIHCGANHISPATHRNESCGPTWNKSAGFMVRTNSAAAAKELKVNPRRPSNKEPHDMRTKMAARSTGGCALTNSI